MYSLAIGTSAAVQAIYRVNDNEHSDREVLEGLLWATTGSANGKISHRIVKWGKRIGGGSVQGARTTVKMQVLRKGDARVLEQLLYCFYGCKAVERIPKRSSSWTSGGSSMVSSEGAISRAADVFQ